MIQLIRDFDIILSEGESYTVEFKESADKTLPSEVCAFANASGGRIFIGVSDDNRAVGTDTSNAARSRIQDTVNQIEPHLMVDVAVYDNIIVITVPEGSSKPYSCAKGFYLRSGPNSQKLSRGEIVAFFQSEGQIRYDTIVRSECPINKLFDEEAYNRYLENAQISPVLNKESILLNLNCAADIDGKLCFTNAGALFFRKNDVDVMYRHAGVVCALYKGSDKAYIIDAKEYNDDVISNIDNAIKFLKSNLHVHYEIEDIQRKNVLEIPEKGLREAVINAVCHRDYFELGARVMVEIFDDRVDITSPGGVPKGITKDNFGKVSITRNSVIASMLYRIDYIEQMGTGIARMKLAAKEANIAEPEFDLEDFFKVTFTRTKFNLSKTNQEATKKRRRIDREVTEKQPRSNQETSKKRPRNNQIVTEKQPKSDQETSKKRPRNDQIVIEKQPRSDQKSKVEMDYATTILNIIHGNESVTIKQLSVALKIGETKIKSIISQLKADGKIKRVGATKNGHWVVNLEHEPIP
ncbi:MAG: putative DNA binding domain-containing protein [Lachnospiraceae bacterium]|nr:putative DNA binding domain-containing protein [Lachnospiraceae bacterium]